MGSVNPYVENLEEMREPSRNFSDFIPRIEARVLLVTVCVFGGFVWVFREQGLTDELLVVLGVIFLVVLVILGRGDGVGEELVSELEANRIVENSMLNKLACKSVLVNGSPLVGVFSLGVSRRVVVDSEPVMWKVGFCIRSVKPYYFVGFVSPFKRDVGFEGYRLLEEEFKGEETFVKKIVVPDPKSAREWGDYYSRGMPQG